MTLFIKKQLYTEMPKTWQKNSKIKQLDKEKKNKMIAKLGS